MDSAQPPRYAPGRDALPVRASPDRSPRGRFGAFLLAACQPKVQIEAPKEPITINLNVKIEHEIRIKVDEDLDNLFEEEDGIF